MDRKKIINTILEDLIQLKKGYDYCKDQIAIEENIIFFKAARSLVKYIWWLFTRSYKINKQSLLELNDLLPKWDLNMHMKLIMMERKQFPGLIKLIVDKITDNILNYGESHLTVLSVGSGGMELERQVINKLELAKYKGRLTILAVDLSERTQTLAIKNLSSLGLNIKFIRYENNENLNSILTNIGRNRYSVVQIKKNFFDFIEKLEDIDIGITYHSLFKHHLTDDQKLRFDSLIQEKSRSVVEYDGYRSFLSIIPQTIIGWSFPVFLNAEIFSNLRFDNKSKILNTYKSRKNYSLSFTPIGYYMLEYIRNN